MTARVHAPTQPPPLAERLRLPARGPLPAPQRCCHGWRASLWDGSVAERVSKARLKRRRSFPHSAPPNLPDRYRIGMHLPSGNLEQYSLSAISVLAEWAVTALVPR